MGRDPGLMERRERPVEPAARRGTPRVLVHHITAGRRVHGREDGNEVDPGLGLAAHGVEELVARDRLVRDHQDVAHVRTSSSTGVLSPLKTACRAPGTPYSYGPPTTCGISSKLKTGGGEDTCHSIVSARHGFEGAGSPRVQETIML